MGQTAQGAQQAVAEPRVAATAEPHKRRAVAAGNAVETAAIGGKPLAVDEGAWTTVQSRRARRRERSRLGVASSCTVRKAAAARVAATRSAHDGGGDRALRHGR
eukprot:1013928-Prymnesium_polylepis.1